MSDNLYMVNSDQYKEFTAWKEQKLKRLVLQENVAAAARQLKVAEESLAKANLELAEFGQKFGPYLPKQLSSHPYNEGTFRDLE